MASFSELRRYSRRPGTPGRLRLFGIELVAAFAAELAALRLMATLAGRFGAQATSTTGFLTSTVAPLVRKPWSGTEVLARA